MGSDPERVTVIGLGRFGTSVARTLFEQGYEVTAIDISEARVTDVADHVTLAAQGDGTDEDLLRSLAVDQSHFGIVAQGENMEASALTTLVLKRLQIPWVVARATNDLHGELLRRVGANLVIFPERDAGVRLGHSLSVHAAIDYIPLTNTSGIAKLTAPPHFIGDRLEILSAGHKSLEVLLIKRGTSVITNPSPAEIIRPGDILVVVGLDKSIDAFTEVRTPMSERRSRRQRAAARNRRRERFQIRPGRGIPRIMQFRDERERRDVPSLRLHAQLFVLSLAAVLVVGTVLLALPWTTANGQATPVLDAFFTAVSAACLTGLVTVDTQTHWNGFGQAVILVLMQIGTFGFLVGASIILQVLRRGSSLQDAILLRDGEPALSLREVRSLAGSILWFILVVEAIGTVVVTLGLLPSRSLPDALWNGVFYTVAALSNSGFDLAGGFQSLIPYQSVIWFNIVIMILIQTGSLGFLVLNDVWQRKRWRLLALDTKLVLVSNAVLLAVGAGFFLVLEWAGAMAAAPAWAKPMISLFQSVSTRTAGFATVNLAEASAATLFLFSILMIIGGAPAATAGGVRLTTVVVVVVAVSNTLAGRSEPQVMGRRLPVALVFRAITVIVLFMAVHGAATVALYFTENHFGGAEIAFLPLLFEAASAIATAGLSTGITPGLTDAGKLVLCVTMLLGRIGPLTAVYALQQHQRPVRYRYPVEPVRIG